MNAQLETQSQSKTPDPTQECIDREIPIQLSMAGYNAFYHHCDVYHGRSNYAVCQHTIDAVREERVQLRSECPDAINCNSCPALRMRAREQDAGRALYFIDRRESLKKLQAEMAKSSEVVKFGKRDATPGEFKPYKPSVEELKSSKSLSEPTRPAPKIKANEDIDVELVNKNMLGEAITNMMENLKDG